MKVPDWYALILLSLAAFRVWRIAGIDSIYARPRARLPAKVVTFLECPWCAGFWIAGAWWVAFQVWPFGTLVAAAPFAVATIAAAVWALPV